MTRFRLFLFVLAGSVSISAAAGALQPRMQQDLRRVLGILSYLVADYPEAVDDAGQVFDTFEHEEHLELLETAESLLKPAPRVHGILHDLDAIHRDVVAHRPPAEVCDRLRDLQGKILKAYDVRIEPGSAIARALGTTQLRVNSFHHQGVRELAPSLTASGWSNDGLIEAFEQVDEGWIVAAQWHPEEMHGDAAAADLGLFRTLVAEAVQAQERTPAR